MSVVKQADYEGVCTSLRKVGLVEAPDFDALVGAYPHISRDTIAAIWSQDCVARIRGAHGKHRSPKRLEDYARRWRGGESLSSLGASIDFPPCSLARLLIPCLLGPEHQAKVSKILSQPELLLVDRDGPSTSDRAANHQGDGVEDGDGPLDRAGRARLARELDAICALDVVSSPIVTNVKRAVGLAHELFLYDELRAAGLAFDSEDDLRRRGAPTTPDALLKIPFAVGGAVVHWIDSKASFGSQESFFSDGLRQFRKYVNRFGPGLVIYWFGYCADLSGVDDSILIRTQFPTREEILSIA